MESVMQIFPITTHADTTHARQELFPDLYSQISENQFEMTKYFVLFLNSSAFLCTKTNFYLLVLPQCLFCCL